MTLQDTQIRGSVFLALCEHYDADWIRATPVCSVTNIWCVTLTQLNAPLEVKGTGGGQQFSPLIEALLSAVEIF
jgi:hypothetical protein